MHRRGAEAHNSIHGVGIQTSVKVLGKFAGWFGAVYNRFDYFPTELTKYFGQGVVRQVTARN